MISVAIDQRMTNHDKVMHQQLLDDFDKSRSTDEKLQHGARLKNFIKIMEYSYIEGTPKPANFVS